MSNIETPKEYNDLFNQDGEDMIYKYNKNTTLENGNQFIINNDNYFIKYNYIFRAGMWFTHKLFYFPTYVIEESTTGSYIMYKHYFTIDDLYAIKHDKERERLESRALEHLELQSEIRELQRQNEEQRLIISNIESFFIKIDIPM